MKKSLSIALLVISFCSAAVYAQNGIVPVIGQTNTSAGTTSATTGINGINYNGGPVMVGPHNVYFIWYGSWGGNSALNILPNLISGLNGSLYFNTNLTYWDNSNRSVADTVTMGSQVFDSYSQGSVLSDQALQNVISAKLNSGALPTDSNGIYFVLTSADVDEKGADGEFCVQFCGFHNHATLRSTDIKFAFVGNIDRCPSACAAPNLGPGPNGNPGADAMANVMAHELNETVTDPDLNAWFDSSGQEDGDKCNFNFGPTFTAPDGAPANVTLAGMDFLIQQNWINYQGGSCSLALSDPPEPAAPVVDMFRYNVPGQPLHFYTTAFAEQQFGRVGYNLEGIGFHTVSPQQPGSVPLYRYSSSTSGDHFYTTNFSELGNGCCSYTYEGIQTYVYPSQISGTIPLYRYRSATFGTHFYTTNANEVAGSSDWILEGIQCYVFP